MLWGFFWASTPGLPWSKDQTIGQHTEDYAGHGRGHDHTRTLGLAGAQSHHVQEHDEHTGTPEAESLDCAHVISERYPLEAGHKEAYHHIDEQGLDQHSGDLHVKEPPAGEREISDNLKSSYYIIYTDYCQGCCIFYLDLVGVVNI